MIFDTNKCIACQTCTVACKTTWTPGRGQEYMFWNNVETKPYGFYPLGWDVTILEKLGVQPMDGPVYGGKTLFDAAPSGEAVLGYLPEDLDYAHPNIGEDDSTGLMPQGAHLDLPHMQWMFYLPRICNHCTYPACLSACPRQTIYKRREDGIVLLDQSRCRGYRECVRGCPYKKVYFNAQTRVSEKCIGCYPAVEGGRQTQCTVTCIGKIRIQGFLGQPDRADPDNPLDYLVFEKKLAVPLYPQFGLEPNTYYIPPVHVPPAYLRQMFGWGVEAAIAAYRKAAEDRKLLGALTLFGATPEISHYFRVDGDWVVGYDAKQSEIVRVPIREPVIVRELYDIKHKVYRTNIT
jgi:nitrate reductase beta subunit